MQAGLREEQRRPAAEAVAEEVAAGRGEGAARGDGLAVTARGEAAIAPLWSMP